MKVERKLTGFDAIRYAARHDLMLCCHADPVGEWRDDLYPNEAREIAKEDPSLVYLEVPARLLSWCGALPEETFDAVRHAVMDAQQLTPEQVIEGRESIAEIAVRFVCGYSQSREWSLEYVSVLARMLSCQCGDLAEGQRAAGRAAVLAFEEVA